MQELYSAVPIALAPVLGNPILLAAFGVDTSAPLPQQAGSRSALHPAFHAFDPSVQSGMFLHNQIETAHTSAQLDQRNQCH